MCALLAHPGFDMSARELIDATLRKSGHGDIEGLEADIWRDLQPDFRTSHYLGGFAHADKKFHFKADWARVPLRNAGMMGPWDRMPSLPDHWAIIEEVDPVHPFRLATSPFAQLSQYHIQRDAFVTGTRRRTDCNDPSRRCFRV